MVGIFTPSIKKLLFLIALITLYRALVLVVASDHIDLFADEAYYWGWAQHFDWGYYSKPPMVAWLIMLSSALFGDTFVGIKAMSLVLYPLTTVVIYFLAKQLFESVSIAFYSALAFVTLPAVWLSSMLISTDVPFLLFWSLSMLFFLKALKEDRWRDWLFAGLAAGAGLLSKYTMIIFLCSAVGFLLFSPSHRRHLVNPKLYAAMVVAVLVFAPNLWWNATHNFVSFYHTKDDNAHIDGLHFHLQALLSFLGSQFGVFGPILFGWLLAILFNIKTIFNQWRYLFLWWFIVPMFALIVTVSLLSRAFANWSAPMYIASTILVSAWLLRRNSKRWLLGAILLNSLLGIMLYHWHDLLKIAHIPPSKKIDPYHRVMGWRLLAQKVAPFVQKMPKARLLFDDRKVMALMIYYLVPHPFDAQFWCPACSQPGHRWRNQYEMSTDMRRHIGENFLLITRHRNIAPIASRFHDAKHLATLYVPLYKDFAMRFEIYYLHDFRGYAKDLDR